MAESEKMVALKKAYAEMILNTAKEAASQVMASEKKAFRYQQDLLTTKEEALRLLVRLKQMIDAKDLLCDTVLEIGFIIAAVASFLLLLGVIEPLVVVSGGE